MPAFHSLWDASDKNLFYFLFLNLFHAPLNFNSDFRSSPVFAKQIFVCKFSRA